MIPDTVAHKRRIWPPTQSHDTDTGYGLWHIIKTQDMTPSPLVISTHFNVLGLTILKNHLMISHTQSLHFTTMLSLRLKEKPSSNNNVLSESLAQVLWCAWCVMTPYFMYIFALFSVYIRPISCLYSPYFLPIITQCPAYIHFFSCMLSPIFCLYSPYFLPIFTLFSAYIQPISCLYSPHFLPIFTLFLACYHKFCLYSRYFLLTRGFVAVTEHARKASLYANSRTPSAFSPRTPSVSYPSFPRILDPVSVRAPVTWTAEIHL